MAGLTSAMVDSARPNAFEIGGFSTYVSGCSATCDWTIKPKALYGGLTSVFVSTGVGNVGGAEIDMDMPANRSGGL